MAYRPPGVKPTVSVGPAGASLDSERPWQRQHRFQVRVGHQAPTGLRQLDYPTGAGVEEGRVTDAPFFTSSERHPYS